MTQTDGALVPLGNDGDEDRMVRALEGDVTEVTPSRGLLTGRWGIPLAWSAAFLVVGMAYMLAYAPLVQHVSEWQTGGDLWGIFRAAHYIGWGDLAGVYKPETGVIAFPGMPVLLAPVAMLSGSLGLSESVPGNLLLHPAAALLLQPVELVLGCTVLFAASSTARDFGLSTWRRVGAVGAVAVVAWPVAAIWGHAEDVVTVALLLWALRAFRSGSWRAGGWLMGLGILMQPLIGFVLPLAIALAPGKGRGKLLVRSLVPSAVLVGVALLGDFSDTVHAILKQPTPPAVNHGTPWVGWATRIGPKSVFRREQLHSVVDVHGHFHVITKSIHGYTTIEVSAGPVRLIGALLAVLVGVWVWRRRPDVTGVFWLCALALSFRCYFEPVMTPYYLAPPLIVALLAAAGSRPWRFVLAILAAWAVTIYAYYHLSPWVWWLPVVGLLTIVLACGYPGRTHLGIRQPESTTASPTDPPGSDGVPPTSALAADPVG